MVKRKRSDGGRARIIETVQTPLGFFVLVVLVVESILGVVAGLGTGPTTTVSIVGMLVIIVGLIAIVAYLAYQRPEALGGRRAPPGAGADPARARFLRDAEGCWWSYQLDAAALGFVHIVPVESSATLQVAGRSYDRDGYIVATWETIASCLNPKGKKLYYYWKGLHPARPAEPYEGFGEIAFEETAEGSHKAVSVFSDTNLTDAKSTTKKWSNYERCIEPAELEVMQKGDRERIAALVRAKLKPAES